MLVISGMKRCKQANHARSAHSPLAEIKTVTAMKNVAIINIDCKRSVHIDGLVTCIAFFIVLITQVVYYRRSRPLRVCNLAKVKVQFAGYTTFQP